MKTACEWFSTLDSSLGDRIISFVPEENKNKQYTTLESAFVEAVVYPEDEYTSFKLANFYNTHLKLENKKYQNTKGAV